MSNLYTEEEQTMIREIRRLRSVVKRLEEELQNQSEYMEVDTPVGMLMAAPIEKDGERVGIEIKDQDKTLFIVQAGADFDDSCKWDVHVKFY